ncbi:MAG: hypothetical protein NC922_02800 [Candidatus Omnitrophica bacterium]|nr:hypothetical protein [Candidatus Omnitrophota bacterium]
MKTISKKLLNLGIGSIYFFKEKLKKIIEEIEDKGKKHSEDLENLKKEIVKICKIPKGILRELIKSIGFVTKEELEKLKDEIKNG